MTQTKKQVEDRLDWRCGQTQADMHICTDSVVRAVEWVNQGYLVEAKICAGVGLCCGWPL